MREAELDMEKKGQMGELCEGKATRLDDQLGREGILRAGALSASCRGKTIQSRFPAPVAIWRIL